MIKRQHRFSLILFPLIVSVIALFFWYTPQAHAEVKKDSPVFNTRAEQEPITPIPLVMDLDPDKVALGRRLFNDTRLSNDNSISCASCHDLTKGGDDGLPYSIGIDGKEGSINAPTVFNSGFNFRQFWDGRAATLEDQIDFPMQNPDELGSTMAEIITKLNKDETYRRDFTEIYQQEIKPEDVRNAIATFERSLITPNAKFDRYLRGDENALDEDELAGYQSFKNLGCISCHQGMNVGGNLYEKFGLANDYFAARGNVQKTDYGRYNITKVEHDRYEFRVPSLRNVELTAPYFHDASATTLEQAVVAMAKFQLGTSLSEDEISKIVKFLKTLTGVYQSELDQ